MDHFTIRDIENLCGIKAHTLRIWEQRYNLFTPKRKESRHRIYDCNDLKHLLRIAFLYHQGFRISKIAELDASQIQQTVESCCKKSCNYENFVHQLIDASIDYDKDKFEKIINGIILRIGLDKAITHLFYPFLERIGLLWLTGNVIPAQEHFSSNIIREKIICAIDRQVEPAGSGKSVLIFAPTGELHEIPLLVANYNFRRNNISTVYFGTNVSIESLEYYCRYKPVTHFYTHVITYLKNPGISCFIDELAKNFPDKKLVISGPCCKCVELNSNRVTFLSSLDELISYSSQVI
jgi:MerR family transcriptional regulator, light-induced transcriptional regulator